MKRKIITIAIATGIAAMATPAQASGFFWGGSSGGSSSGGWGGWGHTHYCGCGHETCTGSSGGTTTGGTTTGGTTTGGTTTGGSSGGTEVPEPGALGLLGAAALGLGVARRRRRKAKA